MSSRSILDLDAQLQPLCTKFIEQCKDAGIHAIITCTYRSNAEQDLDYAQGRTSPGPIITNARSGSSAHNCVLENTKPAARAFDFAIQTTTGTLDWDANDEQWRTAISIGLALGLVSGSCWKMKDNPHFELKDWNAPIH